MSLRGHVSSVYQVAWSADSRLLVSGSSDSTLKVWDVKTGKLNMDLPGHADEVRVARVLLAFGFAGQAATAPLTPVVLCAGLRSGLESRWAAGGQRRERQVSPDVSGQPSLSFSHVPFLTPHRSGLVFALPDGGDSLPLTPPPTSPNNLMRGFHVSCHGGGRQLEEGRCGETLL